tara:strand:- start:1273 stop:1662 length:390 start_codon:yes stop_codon:yes gene_type:complete
MKTVITTLVCALLLLGNIAMANPYITVKNDVRFVGPLMFAKQDAWSKRKETQSLRAGYQFTENFYVEAGPETFRQATPYGVMRVKGWGTKIGYARQITDNLSVRSNLESFKYGGDLLKHSLETELRFNF